MMVQPPQHADLVGLLARSTPMCETSAVWGNGALPLRIRGYLSDEFPPVHLITSVRGIVLRAGDVLVCRNQDDTHYLPGGRRKPGESFEETLRREVFEETGWEIDSALLLGFLHLRHLAAKPPNYPYAHPDFFQLVYVCRAVSFDPTSIDPDGYEVEAVFRPVADVLSLQRAEGPFLEAAIAVWREKLATRSP